MTKAMEARQRQIVDRLIAGYEADEIASELGVRKRTVKRDLAILYKQFGIVNGVKRVKLAVLMYRKQLCSLRENGDSQSSSVVG